MKSYFNMRTSYGVETVDEICLSDFPSLREFRAERKRLVNEYHMCGMNVYISQRCDKTWNE